VNRLFDSVVGRDLRPLLWEYLEPPSLIGFGCSVTTWTFPGASPRVVLPVSQVQIEPSPWYGLQLVLPLPYSPRITVDGASGLAIRLDVDLAGMQRDSLTWELQPDQIQWQDPVPCAYESGPDVPGPDHRRPCWWERHGHAFLRPSCTQFFFSLLSRSQRIRPLVDQVPALDRIILLLDPPSELPDAYV
jgi:hypothetical protein